MKGTELVAFAIVAVSVIMWMAWPSARGDRRLRAPRRPEGPAHPYRRAAAKPKARREETADDAELGWAPPEEELIPSRLVQIAARTGRRWEAIAFLEAEIAASPDPDLAYLLARTLAEHGDHPGAERWLITAARLGQRDVDRARADEALEPLRQRPAWPSIEAALRGD